MDKKAEVLVYLVPGYSHGDPWQNYYEVTFKGKKILRGGGGNLEECAGIIAESLIKQRVKKYIVYSSLCDAGGNPPLRHMPQGSLVKIRTKLEELLNPNGILRNTFPGEYRGHAERVAPVIATLGLLSGIFFLSNNITGNTIVDLSTNTTSWIGGVLLVIGLVAGFFWIRSKKKNLL